MSALIQTHSEYKVWATGGWMRGIERKEPTFRAAHHGGLQQTPQCISIPTFHRWVTVSNGRAIQSNAMAAGLSWLLSVVGTMVFAGFVFVWMMSFGLIIAIAVLFVALGLGRAMFTRYGAWNGECPHCLQEIWISGGRHAQIAIDCPICTKRVFLKDGRFRAV